MDSPKSTSRRGWLYALAGVGAVAAFGYRPAMNRLYPAAPIIESKPVVIAPAPEIPKIDPRQEALRRVENSLAWADQQSDFWLEQHLHRLDLFFGEAKGRTKAFSTKMLGFKSKWKMAVDKAPFTRNDRHEEFVRKSFNDDLFTPAQLQQATEQVAQGYVDSLTGVENVMLVRLRADLSDLPASALPAFANEDRLRSAYAQAMNSIHQKVSSEVNVTLTRETTSLIVSEVLAFAAIRLGVSAGILSVGAGTSWTTLGIGLVAGLAVDQIITFVWDQYRDPTGDMSRVLQAKITEMRRLIIYGDQKTTGLRGKLVELAHQRSDVRRMALRNLIMAEEKVASVP